MSQINSVSRKSEKARFPLLICAIVALMAAVPLIVEFVSTTTHADGGNVAGLVARLTGDPIGGVTPRGSANYFAAPSGSPPPRQLFVSVNNVNLPDNTLLQVSLNNAPIGTFTLHRHPGAPAGSGSLVLSTNNGGTVPTVVAGDSLTVGAAPAAGAVIYLSGTFGGPPTPSPSGSHTPFPTPSHTASPSPSGTPLPARAFAARMNGASEVPPVTTNGVGFGFVALNPAGTQIRVCLGFRNLSSDATAITINGPASTTENGPVIFTLTLPTTANGFSSQTFDVTADQVAQLRARSFYFQVATTNNPVGEIRGQINPITPRFGGGPHGGGNGGGGMRSFVQLFDNDESDGRTYIAVPFDFDGDGLPDIAAFSEVDGLWNITQTSNGRTVRYETE